MQPQTIPQPKQVQNPGAADFLCLLGDRLAAALIQLIADLLLQFPLEPVVNTDLDLLAQFHGGPTSPALVENTPFRNHVDNHLV